MVKRFLRERSGNTPGGSRHLPQAGATRAPSFATVGRGIRAGEAETRAQPARTIGNIADRHPDGRPAWNEEVTA